MFIFFFHIFLITSRFRHTCPGGRCQGKHADAVALIQAALRRSSGDVETLIREGARVRLCKGAYNEPPESEAFPTFGSKELIISVESPESAKEDANRLEVEPKARKRIITGALLTGEHNDKTRSGRDMSILCSLIHHNT